MQPAGKSSLSIRFNSCCKMWKCRIKNEHDWLANPEI
jgi:hypothetical protein